MTRRLMEISALTEELLDEPNEGEQFRIVKPDGSGHIFGDQEWVRSGEALGLCPEGSMIQRRTVTIVYGDWEPVP